MQKYPQEQRNSIVISYGPYTQRSILEGILDVGKGGDLKLSGLRQLFLAIICSLKSPFSRDSAAFEQSLITSVQIVPLSFLLNYLLALYENRPGLSLPLPQAQPRCSSALSESQPIKEAEVVDSVQCPSGHLGTGLLLEGSCSVGCSARRHWWPSILDAWRGKAAQKMSKGQSQAWEAEMESRGASVTKCSCCVTKNNI